MALPSIGRMMTSQTGSGITSYYQRENSNNGMQPERRASLDWTNSLELKGRISPRGSGGSADAPAIRARDRQTIGRSLGGALCQCQCQWGNNLPEQKVRPNKRPTHPQGVTFMIDS